MNRSTLFVTVGTDHHPFNRLSGWIEEWVREQGDTVTCIFQQGSSRLPEGALGVGIVSKVELLELITKATVVVAQAGPGSIIDANSRGVVPIVVPRRAHLHEVVDDHQVAFAHHMAEHGAAIVAETREALHQSLACAIQEPERMRIPSRQAPTQETVLQLASVVLESTAKPPGVVNVQRLRDSIRSWRERNV